VVEGLADPALQVLVEVVAILVEVVAILVVVVVEVAGPEQ
jgi:hypothetical protein